MLLICSSSVQKGLYAVCFGLCIYYSVRFLAQKVRGLLRRNARLWNSPSCLTWLLNWGRPVNCRELQFIGRQWQRIPEDPATTLRSRAGLGLQLHLSIMCSHWLSSFNSWIFRLLSRLHKSTAPKQKLQVKCLQAVPVLKNSIWLSV